MEQKLPSINLSLDFVHHGVNTRKNSFCSREWRNGLFEIKKIQLSLKKDSGLQFKINDGKI